MSQSDSSKVSALQAQNAALQAENKSLREQLQAAREGVNRGREVSISNQVFAEGEQQAVSHSVEQSALTQDTDSETIEESLIILDEVCDTDGRRTTMMTTSIQPQQRRNQK